MIVGAWAKLEDGYQLPLFDHGADVAAVFTAIIGDTEWSARLRHAAGRPLTRQDEERLSALACIHDLGKTNVGFWSRQFEGSPITGHTNETAALFVSPLLDRPEVAALLELVGDWGADELFRAVMAHHGTPLEPYHESSDLEHLTVKYQRHWRPHSDYDPLSALAALLDAVRHRFPLAFEAGPLIPDTPAFVSLVCGLVTLADWLGSDTRLFPVVAPHGAAREPVRASAVARALTGRELGARATPGGDFADAFGSGTAPITPRGIQRAANRLDLGRVALFEAETGSGKTEAALWRWLALRRAGLVDGLYFALPTRSAAVQLHIRVQRMLDRVFGAGATEAVLAVPGYLRAGDAEGQRLPAFAVQWSDAGQHDGRWAAESARRFLAARVAVGTIDQALMAGLQLRHAHFRAAMLARSLLVVDEVHASDAFMGEVLRAVLRNHIAYGGHALLLSATLGAAARTALLDVSGRSPIPSLAVAEATPYPVIAGTDLPPSAVPTTGTDAKRVALAPVPLIADPEAVAAEAVAAAGRGASVLVIRNSVAGAIAVARAIEAQAPALTFRVGNVPTLHHGRFAPSDRRLLDHAVESAFGKARSAAGRVLVGTQTLEQSLDIDADLLITDLAPMDILLQRIGRLHRHQRYDRGAFGAAHAIVLVPPERDLSRYLGRVADRHGLGPLKSGEGVYPDLVAIEGTWRMIEANMHVTIPADNRRLVEGALHPEVAAALKVELGPEWMNHANQQDGIAIYERGLARDFALDVTQLFSTLLFPAVDQAVSTRLGARDRLVDFEAPFDGPFGAPVERLTIPGWMAGGIGAEALPEEVAADLEGTTFQLGERRYHYGRFGLEQAFQT